MCENEEINRLLSLNFIGFQADVENTLLFKSRNTNPRQKPDYAQVLHGWYVFRGDYRSGECDISIPILQFQLPIVAAAAMYQHGKRLGELQPLQNVDFVEIGSLQAMSLLTAINALSLVNVKDAWVEYVSPPTEAIAVGPIPVRLILSHTYICSASEAIPTHSGRILCIHWDRLPCYQSVRDEA